ncbi:MAG: hydrogenase iron-sulfur subunit, partial [Candidatus Promineofilum sp.]|nr:hydrogenase iron-sulfur subunit [Promineifilum sp.]
SRALEAGAAGVSVVGCPPEDCANREGNTWAEQRLTRQRLPRLRKPYIDAPVTAAYLPPDAFAQGLSAPVPATESGAPDYAATRGMGRTFSLRHFGPALALLAVALLLQILLTDLPLRPYPDQPAVVQLVSGDLGAAFGNLVAGQAADSAYRLEVLVDGQEALRRSFTAEELVGLDREDKAQFFHELPVAPGEHALTVRLIGETTGATFVLFDGRVTAGAGAATQPPLGFDGPLPCPSDHVCAQ